MPPKANSVLVAVLSDPPTERDQLFWWRGPSTGQGVHLAMPGILDMSAKPAIRRRTRYALAVALWSLMK
jgi:hypothetical protein